MLKVDIRNVLDYGIESAYEIFKPMHENLCYSDMDSKWEILREPIFTDFKSFESALEYTNIFFIVLEESEEKIVGYIILDAFNSGAAQIKEIMIKPEERKHGYGRRAVKLLMEILKEDEDIKSLCVVSATMATDNFYSSCGFRYSSGNLYEYRW